MRETRVFAGQAIIRKMIEADLDTVASLERSVYERPWGRHLFARMIELPSGIACVATLNEQQVIGYALGWSVGDEAELANIAVSEPYRRRGIGASLLDAYCQRAKAIGAERMFLEVRASNAMATSLYHKQGFRVVGRRSGYYSRPDEDAVVMRLDLVDPPFC